MNRELLPKNFIKKHPLKEYSAARFADLNIRLVHADELNAEIDKIIIPRIEQDRREAILQGEKHIEEIETAEEIVAQMRKKNEMSIIPLLCKKALTIQDEVMPLVLRRYKTSIQDHFIETAVRLFGNADRKYTIDLFHQYHEIRNEYARSICLGNTILKNRYRFCFQNMSVFQIIIPRKAMTKARFSPCIFCAEKRNEVKLIQGSRA